MTEYVVMKKSVVDDLMSAAPLDIPEKTKTLIAEAINSDTYQPSLGKVENDALYRLYDYAHRLDNKSMRNDIDILRTGLERNSE